MVRVIAINAVVRIAVKVSDGHFSFACKLSLIPLQTLSEGYILCCSACSDRKDSKSSRSNRCFIFLLFGNRLMSNYFQDLLHISNPVSLPISHIAVCTSSVLGTCLSIILRLINICSSIAFALVYWLRLVLSSISIISEISR